MNPAFLTNRNVNVTEAPSRSTDVTEASSRSCFPRTLRLEATATIALAVFAMLFPQPVFGQSEAKSIMASISVFASEETVQVAEPFEFRVDVVAPVGSQVTFPPVTDQFGEFDVIDKRDLFDVPMVESNDLRSWSRLLTLESVSTGELEIPTIAIQVTQDGVTKPLNSEPTQVRVASVLEDRADPMQFRDIHSVVDIEVPEEGSYAWLWWSLGGTGGLIIATAIVAAITRRKTWLTPQQWAIQEIEDLRSSPEFASTNGEAVLHRLSTLMREYLMFQFEIERGCGFQPQRIKELRLEDTATTALIDLFALADQAKFAGLKLSAKELEKTLDDAQELTNRIAQRVNSWSEVSVKKAA